MSTERMLQLRLTDQLGNYLDRVQIALMPQGGDATEPTHVETDDRGLVFVPLAAGRYRIQASCHTLYREVSVNLERDESLTVRLFPTDRAQLNLKTEDRDSREPVPAFIIIQGDTPAFPAFPDRARGDAGSTGAIFTDGRGVASLFLPPGRYHLKATHGFAFEPVEKEITLEKDERRTAVFSLARRFTVPSGWYCGDDHVHCLQCWPGHHPACPDFPVEVAARVARANDLDWFTPTDNLDPRSDLYLPRTEREAQNDPGRFLCLIGDELGGSNQEGSFHCNVVGIDAPVGERGVVGRVGEVLPEILRQGGTANICHIFLGSGALREIEDTPDLPNLEVWSCEDDIDRSMPVWYEFLNRGRRLYAVAHSDSTTLYWPGDFVGVRRTYVDIRDHAFTQEAVVSALRNGHSFCTDGPLLFFSLDGKGPGESVEKGAPWEIDIEVFSLTPLVEVSLIASGRKIRQWSASGDRFHIREVLEPGDFSWILATAEAESTVYAPARTFKGFAFTNPVWIQGKGHGE